MNKAQNQIQNSHDRTKIVYISGPMTGLPHNNYPAFIEAHRILEQFGYNVLSPHKAPECSSWEEYMRHDLKMLCDADVICLLPGWQNSRGAMLEKYVADRLGLTVWFLARTENNTFKLSSIAEKIDKFGKFLAKKNSSRQPPAPLN